MHVVVCECIVLNMRMYTCTTHIDNTAEHRHIFLPSHLASGIGVAARCVCCDSTPVALDTPIHSHNYIQCRAISLLSVYKQTPDQNSTVYQGNGTISAASICCVFGSVWWLPFLSHSHPPTRRFYILFVIIFIVSENRNK